MWLPYPSQQSYSFLIMFKVTSHLHFSSYLFIFSCGRTFILSKCSYLIFPWRAFIPELFLWFFFLMNLFIYLFLAVLGLRFCARAFSSCGERGPFFTAMRGSLTTAASLVVEHRLQTCRLSSCGSRAQLLRGMWDLPRPGLEPVSPELAGRFSTTAPPGKPSLIFISI